MGKWEMVRLGDVCEILSGSTPSTNSPELWNGGIKWVTPAELSDNSYFVFDTERHISEKAGLRAMPAGTVLLSSRAPIGKVAIAGVPMCCNQGFKNLVCSERIHNRYLYRWLKNQTAFLNSLGRGATFKEISKAIVEDVLIPLPPLVVQEKIADVLDRAAALIDKRKAQIAKLDLLVKSQFLEMFGDPVANPMGWESKLLMEISDVGSSRRVFVSELVEKGIPFFRGTEISALSEGLEIIPELFITPEHYDSLRNHTGVPTLGDLLLPSICPDGQIWRVDTEMPFYFKDGRVLWVHFECDSHNRIYLHHAIRNVIVNNYEKIASGTTFAELKIFALKELQVLLPPLILQNDFAIFAECVNVQKERLKKSLALLELNYKSLMQKCFNGEVFA